MKSIKESWAMLKLSGRILARNPFLLSYIVASFLAAMTLFGGALAPVAWNLKQGDTQLLEPYAHITDLQAAKKSFKAGIRPNWGPLASAAAAVYFLGTFILVFMNVAFLASVKRIVNGKEASFTGGLRLAWEQRAAVLQWALFSATVGALFAVVKSKLDNWLARRVLGLAELGWNLAVFLAVPVVAAEGGTPVAALRRSAGLFRRTWGQTIAGGVGIGVLQLAVWLAAGVLPGIVLFYLGLADTGAHYPLVFAGIAWMFLALLLVVLLSEAVTMIFRMVLYVFAAEGAVPEEYREQDCAWFVAQRPEAGRPGEAL